MFNPFLRRVVACLGLLAHLRIYFLADVEENVLGRLEVKFRHYRKQNPYGRLYRFKKVNVDRRIFQLSHKSIDFPARFKLNGSRVKLQ